MLYVSILVEFIIHRLRGAVYGDWTEDKVLLRCSIVGGSVEFSEFRDVLGDLFDLWPSIRPFIIYTGLPQVKERVDRVSLFCSVLSLPVF